MKNLIILSVVFLFSWQLMAIDQLLDPAKFSIGSSNREYHYKGLYYKNHNGTLKLIMYIYETRTPPVERIIESALTLGKWIKFSGTQSVIAESTHIDSVMTMVDPPVEDDCLEIDPATDQLILQKMEVDACCFGNKRKWQLCYNKKPKKTETHQYNLPDAPVDGYPLYPLCTLSQSLVPEILHLINLCNQKGYPIGFYPEFLDHGKLKEKQFRKALRIKNKSSHVPY